jgi:hypothetical protein
VLPDVRPLRPADGGAGHGGELQVSIMARTASGQNGSRGRAAQMRRSGASPRMGRTSTCGKACAMAGEVSEADIAAAARQPVARRKHGPEGVVEQVNAVVGARTDLGTAW